MARRRTSMDGKKLSGGQGVAGSNPVSPTVEPQVGGGSAVEAGPPLKSVQQRLQQRGPRDSNGHRRSAWSSRSAAWAAAVGGGSGEHRIEAGPGLLMVWSTVIPRAVDADVPPHERSSGCSTTPARRPPGRAAVRRGLLGVWSGALADCPDILALPASLIRDHARSCLPRAHRSRQGPTRSRVVGSPEGHR